jgi:hypothetical protein
LNGGRHMLGLLWMVSVSWSILSSTSR